MISAEQARDELAKIRVPWDHRRGLTIRNRLLAPALAGEVVDAVNRRRAVDPDLVSRLDALAEAKRARVFRAVSPTMGDALARWWSWARHAPYQSGWTRRAYRSPDPAHSGPARFADLSRLLVHAAEYPRPLAWHAEWMVHLGDHIPLGGVLAAAIDDGDTAIRMTLVDSVHARHPISGPTTQAHAALLASGDPANWETVAALLRAAGRAEGLRQSILEASDLAHPSAFARILDVVLEHDLSRFAGTVRAAGVWVGDGFDVRRSKDVAAALRSIRAHLDAPPTARDLLVADAADAYLGLWTLAMRDAPATVPVAAELLRSPAERTRLAAARILADLAIPAAGAALAPALDDESLAVYAAAADAWPPQFWAPKEASPDLEPAVRTSLEHRVRTLGRSREVPIGIVGERPTKVGSARAADVIVTHTPAEALEPEVLQAASADGRYHAARKYGADPIAHRAPLFSLLDDRSGQVRGVAQEALGGLTDLTDDEVARLEAALSRKSADVRTTAIRLLGAQSPDRLAATVARLSAGTADQRRAGTELGGASAAEVDDTAGPTVDAVPAALDFRPEDRTPAVRPVAPPASDWRRYHAGCRLVLTSLAAWIDEHADTEVQTYGGVQMLANVGWLPVPSDGSLPLAELLEPWWERTAGQLTDGGVELALLHLRGLGHGGWVDGVNRTIIGMAEGPGGVDNGIRLRANLIAALARHAWRERWTDTVLDALDTAAAAVPVSSLLGPPEVMARRGIRFTRNEWGGLRQTDGRGAFFDALFQQLHRLVDPTTLSDDQLGRWWRTARYLDEPEGTFDTWRGARVEIAANDRWGRAQTSTVLVPDQPYRSRPAPMLVATAFERGIATRADLVDALLVPEVRSRAAGHGGWDDAAGVRELTGLRPEAWAAGAHTQEVVEEVRRVVVERECTRGDLPTPFSNTARGLRTAYGAESLVQILAALGTRPFTRGYSWNESRESGLSHLVRIHQPTSDDTAAGLGELIRSARIAERRIVEVGVYAPQWAALIEEHLGWPGYASAVWWLHAHTKDESWHVDREIREAWESEISQRTPLEATDLIRGAADVAWFRAMYGEIGDERFRRVLAAAKYASTAGGHKRAERFAQALLGRLEESELLEQIGQKRNQDAVRALGLLPLPDDGRRTLLARYELMRGFVASDRTSGSQRRASETTAVAVGMENLARTAGYRDPQRLTWAMESEAVADLAAGPVSVDDGDLTVTLSIDDGGAPNLAAVRGGRALAAVPAKSRANPEIAALRARATDLKKQAGRMRRSLEDACVLGDAFDAAELATLLAHPVLAPMIRSLVLVDAEGVAGFATDDPAVLRGPDGSLRAVARGLRIAHPLDLLASGEWPEFQHELVSKGVRQPFKQAFRELYTPSAGERDEAGTTSRRYGGHQVQARQAGGIFTSRGWVADFQTGFSRTFHEEKITVWCRLLDGWGTPAEVEDATVTDITFHAAGEWHPMRLEEVPGRVFSEAMRDLDLVVSVAHAGGVDPEASESSVEMRGRLVEETVDLLGLRNVEVGGHHARVKGTLGTYTIHLGSGVVHRVPGNAVCIVPVSAQHRGRIFLPFADDDPRTAEIVAKAVLLARDDKITDPTIVQKLVR
ncbi:DUF5724 domain-containing protein [Agromyces sp. GXS1127]|uniref:DUF5724 domain-containing protein n=1 Tax=Agromyces sp. GXS1127 TaxID=3424181 RepID=UPI003D3215C4